MPFAASADAARPKYKHGAGARKTGKLSWRLSDYLKNFVIMHLCGFDTRPASPARTQDVEIPRSEIEGHSGDPLVARMHRPLSGVAECSAVCGSSAFSRKRWGVSSREMLEVVFEACGDC
jgi:hypothetical protein